MEKISAYPTVNRWKPTTCENARLAFMHWFQEYTEESWPGIEKIEDAMKLQTIVSDFIQTNKLFDFDELSSHETNIYNSTNPSDKALAVFIEEIEKRIETVKSYFRLLRAISIPNDIPDIETQIKTYKPRWNSHFNVFSLQALSLTAPFAESVAKGLSLLQSSEPTIVITIEWSRGEVNVSSQELIAHLSRTYGVIVEPLKTNEEFNRLETLRRGEREGIYFVSEESPEITAAHTEYYLKRRAVRHDVLMGLAHEKQSEQSIEKAKQVNTVISDIIRAYRETNNGNEPNLSAIAERLTQQGVETPRGGSTWRSEQVKRIIGHKGLNR